MSYIIKSKKQIKEQFETFVNSGSSYIDEVLSPNFRNIRDFMTTQYFQRKKEYDVDIKRRKNVYLLDLELALDFYEFMESQLDFQEMDYRSNYDFWAYLATFVFPKIVKDRFDLQPEHFYKKGVRIYPYTLYWYIHLAWQGNRQSTFEVLRRLNTDAILNIVERPSKIGINVDLYREIFKKLGALDVNHLFIKRNGNLIASWRIIMLKNTQKLMVYRPELFKEGIPGYVDMLFSEILNKEGEIQCQL